MRLDVYLVENGFVPTRQKAKTLILNGAVFVDGKAVTKPAFDPTEKMVEIRGPKEKYVSRGGEKLEAALTHFTIDVQAAKCVDIGSSTGGFTDCLLQHGAAFVYCVDSGTGQLHECIANDPRVRQLEKFNARHLTIKEVGFIADCIVMDVSFISQTLLYDSVVPLLAEDGVFISLIKPQFEAGKENVGKGGLVKKRSIHIRILQNISQAAAEKGLYCHELMCSPLRGGDGNIEYLALFRKQKIDLVIDIDKIVPAQIISGLR
ncbi:MAG: TlyA family RNA methyltransferase [Clostridiales bacterium]|nr:TlyA family RNA methyltransferase [Clostridiales bacterium]